MQAHLRVLVDARWVSAAPASSHARYLRALAGQWAQLADGPYVTLLGVGRPPTNLVTSERVRWQAAPDLPGRLRHRPGGRLWLNTVFTAMSLVQRPRVLFFPWSVLPRVLVAPAVVTVHDVCFRSQPSLYPDGGRKGDEQIGAAVRSAAAVLAPTAESKRGIVAAYEVDSERVTVVRHGIEATFGPRHTPSDDAARHALGIGEQYFLCVSTHEERKNLETLLRAYAGFVDGWSESSEPPALVLVGRSNRYTDVLRRQLAKYVRPEQHTRFVEGVSDDVLAALYRGASTVLLPSLCEGFGFPLVEAIACGTPALVSDLPVFRELVGDAATYVPAQDVAAWTDGLNRAISDPSVRARAQAATSRVASDLTWKGSARQTLDVLERVARPPRSGRRRAQTSPSA